MNAPKPPPTDVAPSPDDSVLRAQMHALVDRAYRDVVENLPLQDVLHGLCQRIGQQLDLPLVTLVRRHETGTLETVAASRETSMWAELTRLPERWDGTVAGHGPAARALHSGVRVGMSISEEGFLPWRDAARREGITDAQAWPLDTEEGVWALVCYARAATPGRAPAALEEVGILAATGCRGVIDAARRLEQQRLLKSALDHAGNAAFIADLEGRIVWSNTAFSRLTGYTPGEVRGRNPRFLSSGKHGPSHYRELWNTIRTGRIWRGETVDRDSKGAAFTAMQTISPFGHDDRVTHYLAVYEDISRQKAQQERRELRAGLDPLTGLSHRAALVSAVDAALAQGRPVHLARVALRNLESLGKVGEGALEATLEECNTRVRSVAGAARAAPDADAEYLVWLPDEDGAAESLVAALRTELAEPYPMLGEIRELDLRIGCAQAPRDGLSFDALARVADRAMGIEPLQPARRALTH